jgi:CDP-diacylglycerol--serine O-phosphatidyltransferase
MSNETPPRPRHFSLIRTFVTADLITLGNAASGMAAILLCMSWIAEPSPWRLWAAFAFLPIAFVLDALDGSVARWRKQQSPLGADLDSLSDIVSFGVAPAVLAFTLGMRGGWDALALVYFVSCGISRLARFNVTAAALSDERGKVRYFEGTPIPTSLALVVVLAVAAYQGAIGSSLWFGVVELGPWQLHPLVLMYVASGTAMISATLRVPKP